MTAPVLFDYSGQQVRTVVVDDEPWFVAADVAAVLGYSATGAMTRSLDEDEKGVQILHTLGGEQEMSVVSEAGLFSIILRSQIEGAKAFKRWVTHEVLPTIRRTGSFGQPAALPSKLELAQWFIESEAKREIAEARVAELEPSADAWTALASAEGDYSLREAAEVLSRDPMIVTGQNLLAKFLRDAGWLDRRGIPYQAQINLGRLAVRTSTYDHPHTGEPQLSTQTRVTGKGLDAIRRLMYRPPVAGLRAVPGGS